MTQHTVAALYENRAAADRARSDLIAAGVPGSSVQIGAQEGGRYALERHDGGSEDGGFLNSLKNLFMPDDDAHTYAEGVRRGGVLLTACVDDAQHTRAVDALERTHPLNLDEHSAEWRKSGWSTFDENAAPMSGGLSAATRQATEQDTAIPVVEEELKVGKRKVEDGRVRVRSYVVETPVQESVSLHDEHVSVERRPASGATAARGDAFGEKVVEATETHEEPVVAKDARVKEEVVVRKEAGDRTETVQDKVRRTDVKVEDSRGRTSQRSERGPQIGSNMPRR